MTGRYPVRTISATRRKRAIRPPSLPAALLVVEHNLQPKFMQRVCFPFPFRINPT
jgi:hypothetical protein